MSCITQVPVSADTEKPATKRFRGGFRGGKADPDMVARQARITLLAFQAHDARDRALAFLNDHNDALDGRPLDVAGRDDDGLAAAIVQLEARQV